LAREWVRAGHEVDVVTGPGDRGGEYAPDLVAYADESGAGVYRAPAPGIPQTKSQRAAFSQRPEDLVIRKPVSRLRQLLSQWKSFPDLQRSWIAPGIELARSLHSRRRYDLVVSTSPPESAHYIGQALAADGLPWVADFRDQWSGYLLARWDPVSRWLIDRIATRVLASATLVTGASEGVAASLSRATGRRAECIRNGYDFSPQREISARPRSLGYFGRVDPLAQRPQRLWEPLRRVRHAGRSWSLDFYTAPGGGGGAAISVPPDLTDIVQVHALIPHAAALLCMQEMAALLVLAWEVRGGDETVAGKLYEYVGSGRPVLVCAPAHFEARRLVEATSTGIGAWGVDEITAALERLDAFSPDPEGRASLSRAHAAGRLLSFVSESGLRLR
jgi:hypothetical protein